jgi:DNA-binding HxlR family transcriptional regulator
MQRINAYAARLVSVLRRTYDNQNCSIARALETIGERWTLLILRDAFLGTRRFDDFQKSLGVARNVLTVRLKTLTDQGMLERRRYQERPERYEYRLTQKGIDLWPVLFTLMRFGDKHAADGDDSLPPTLVEHRTCGTAIDDHMCCPACGVQVGAHDVVAKRGEEVASAGASPRAAA